MPTENGPSRDVTPEKNPTATKTKGESFNEAHNPPNNPTKNHQPACWNVTDAYSYDNENE